MATALDSILHTYEQVASFKLPGIYQYLCFVHFYVLHKSVKKHGLKFCSYFNENKKANLCQP